MARKISPGQVIGLGLSCGVTMLVSIAIMYFIGNWIDKKLGLDGVFTFIGILLGIFSGFRLLLENVKDLERPRGREYDAWKEAEDRKRLEQEERKKALKLEKKLKKQQKREQNK